MTETRSDHSRTAPALSVWPSAQTTPASQRRHHYATDSTAHPAKMLPAIAAHAIRHYTAPGELVLDPMCGIGTTLIEAAHAGRHALGVEYEPHWAEITETNLAHARHTAPEASLRVFTGDARHLPALLPEHYREQASLVVTSPPYGASTHGQVTTGSDGVRKYHHRYGNRLDRGNLANLGHHRLLTGFSRILTGAATALRPGGHVVITIRPWREHAELINLPSQITECAQQAGLIPTERCVALLARVAETHLVARGSFFARQSIHQHRNNGLPLYLITHEDVLILRKPHHDDLVPPS